LYLRIYKINFDKVKRPFVIEVMRTIEEVNELFIEPTGSEILVQRISFETEKELWFEINSLEDIYVEIKNEL